MANPALKNGYLSIALELVDQFALHNIPGNEMRIIWVLWRKTWGWKDGDRHKDWDWVSLTQFEKMTGMQRKNVCRSLKSLVAKRLLLHRDHTYKFNQNYNEWIVAKRLPGVANVVSGSGKRGKKGVAKRPHTIETLTKETIQKKDIHMQAAPAGTQEILNLFYEINPGINFGNKTQREAASWLAKRFGVDGALSMVRQVCAVQGKQYAPTVTTPLQMKNKLGDLIIYFKKSNQTNLARL